MTALYPYQAQAANFTAQTPRCLLLLPMGSGKTLTTLTALDNLSLVEDVFPVLVVAPLRVAQSVWGPEVAKWPHLQHLRVSVVTGTPKQRLAALQTEADIYCTNYENIPWLIESVESHFKTIVADECFVAGTKISTPNGHVPIEHLRLGDFVNTIKGPRRVTNVFRKTAKTLVRIYLLDGREILCTPTHLFWTEVGWCEAQYLGDLLVVCDSDLPALRSSVRDYGSKTERPEDGSLLREIMLHTGLDAAKAEILFPGHSSAGVGSSHRRERGLEQRDAVSRRNALKTIAGKSGEGLFERCSRGEWDWHDQDGRGHNPCSESWMGVESPDTNKTACRFRVGGVANLLQAGFLLAGEKDLPRDRWCDAHYEARTGTRREENEGFRSVRVDRVETVECSGSTDVWDIEVEDEHHFFAEGVLVHNCSKLKGYRTRQGSTRAKALAKIAFKAKRFIGLTGTPAPNGVQDLWGQAWFCDRGYRLGASFKAFTNRWFRTVQIGDNAMATKLEPYPHSQAEIESRIQDITYSLDVRDFMDIREPIVNVIKVQLPPKARAIYAQMEQEMWVRLESLSEVEAVNAAVKTMKCLQAASGFLYTDTKRGLWEPIHHAKLDALESVIEEAAGMPVLVAYHFTADLERLLARFPKGKALDASPRTIEQWNRGEIPILFVHPKSAGHGLSLQYGGNIICFYGLDWNLEERLQVIERIGPVRQKQAGFDRPVFVHYIVAEDTIDEVVLKRVDSKKSVLEILMQNLKKA